MELSQRAIEYLKTGRCLPVRNCTLCNALLTVAIDDGKICFDTNCNCVNYRVALTPISTELFNFYAEECKKQWEVLL